jgi:single-strand DNA-binding protein
MNKAFIIGNLTKDVELTTTSSGISVARFTVATQRRFANADGEKVADFHNCVAWRGLAENLAKYCKKGNKVSVVGEIQTRNYDAQDGTKRYVTEIMANEVEFLSSKKSGEGEEPKLTPVDDDNLPF